jgi:hypothetical protein
VEAGIPTEPESRRAEVFESKVGKDLGVEEQVEEHHLEELVRQTRNK